MILIFSLLGIIILGRNVLLSIKKGVYLSIVNIISVIEILDLFFPAILGSFSGKYFALPYVAPLNDSEVLTAVIIADLSFILLLFGYNRFRPTLRKENAYIESSIDFIKVKWVFLISVGIYFLDLYYSYKSFGSWMEFYTFKLTRAYAVGVEAKSGFARIISILAETTYVIILMMFGIMITHKEHYSKRDFGMYITLIIVVCLLSLSRGTIIGLFISIVACLEFKSYSVGGLSDKTKKMLYKYSVIGVCCFLLFGGMRNALQQSHFQDEKTGVFESAIEAANNTFGNSLIALTRTVRYVESGKPLFEGQSYGEMFLSFVPRSIMPNKPSLYGVQNLTMANGSPESTMDAITIPGELLMNFGYIGIIFMLLWGIAFRVVDNLRYKVRLRYFLSAAIFTISTTSCWMSFTGFFSQLKYLIIYYIVLKIVISIYPKRL